MMLGSWNDMWKAIRAALPEHDAQRFLTKLEATGYTVLPLEIRRAADVYGTVAVVKTTDGYGIMDPVYTKVTITRPREEVR